MKQFIYSGLCYCTETKYCLLLLRMARMEMDCILKTLAKIFQILARHLEAMATNVPWITFPAKKLIDIFLLHFKECFGMSKGH